MAARTLELSAEQPPAPRSTGAEGPQLESKGSQWAEVPLPPGMDISRSGPLAKQSGTCGRRASCCVAAVWTGSGLRCLVSPLDAGLIF